MKCFDLAPILLPVLIIVVFLLILFLYSLSFNRVTQSYEVT